MVAVACFLAGRARDLSAPLRIKCRKQVLLSGVSAVKRISLHILDAVHFGVVIIRFILCSGGLRFVFQLKTIRTVFMSHLTFSQRRCRRSKSSGMLRRVIGVVTNISKNCSDFNFSVKKSNKCSIENDCI